MPQAPPAARMLAGRVLSYEAGSSPEPAALAEAADRADARLRGRLAELIGLMGYATLIARAHSLARAEIPTLRQITPEARGNDGSRGVRDYVEFALANSDNPRAAEAALSGILAHVIGLLITFIGEDLALRLVYEAWPEIENDQAATEGPT